MIDWIFNIITNETENVHSFCDLFAGTGVIANKAIQLYDKIVINDFLYSNYSIYQAFFGKGIWSENHILSLINEYNNLHADDLADNYFSINFGGKFFDKDIAKIIGFIREDIEAQKTSLTEKEYHILLASLIYSIDRLANTLGHFDAYIKKEILSLEFLYISMEGLVGFEPTLRELQSHALPLGYRPGKRLNCKRLLEILKSKISTVSTQTVVLYTI